MRYVAMVVVFGLLVVGAGVYSAQSAQGAASHDRRLIEMAGPGKRDHQQYPGTEDPYGRGPPQLCDAASRRNRSSRNRKQGTSRRQSSSASGDHTWSKPPRLYGQDPASLYRVMICESGGDSNADNGVCKGLFQFNPGTWAGTPSADQSIYDGQAQIKAAAWMWSQGRKGEWTCG